MELVKNKASGKSFIVLDDNGDAEFVLITPEGKVKQLDRRLFGPQVTVDNKMHPLNLNITKTQIDKYAEYRKFDDY
jgi:hypothetical protein